MAETGKNVLGSSHEMHKSGHWLPIPEDELEYIKQRPWKCIYIVRYDSIFFRSYCLFCQYLHMLKIPYQMLGAPVGVGKWVKIFCKSWECPIDYGRDKQHKNRPQAHYILEPDRAISASQYKKETGKDEI